MIACRNPPRSAARVFGDLLSRSTWQSEQRRWSRDTTDGVSACSTWQCAAALQIEERDVDRRHGHVMLHFRVAARALDVLDRRERRGVAGVAVAADERVRGVQRPGDQSASFGTMELARSSGRNG